MTKFPQRARRFYFDFPERASPLRMALCFGHLNQFVHLLTDLRVTRCLWCASKKLLQGAGRHGDALLGGIPSWCSWLPPTRRSSSSELPTEFWRELVSWGIMECEIIREKPKKDRGRDQSDNASYMRLYLNRCVAYCVVPPIVRRFTLGASSRAHAWLGLVSYIRVHCWLRFLPAFDHSFEAHFTSAFTHYQKGEGPRRLPVSHLLEGLPNSRCWCPTGSRDKRDVGEKLVHATNIFSQRNVKEASLEESDAQYNKSYQSVDSKALLLKVVEILEKRKTLLVWHQREEFLKILKDNQTLIRGGETSSGKITQTLLLSWIQ
ncbi:hypothetical protein VNO77_03290 [Canavalia gladiata]|uniref:Uncharacterized protein n=1 Tax=Canavalia gladiata TaxID=3824 RepID=A0AAN9MV39_CANGL